VAGKRSEHLTKRLYITTIILLLSVVSIASGNDLIKLEAGENIVECPEPCPEATVPDGYVTGQHIVKPEDRFTFGVGYALVKFDTNVKFTDKPSGLSLFVDTEGTLGLPETDSIPVYYGGYRFSRKHAISFSHFRVRRESTLLGFNETLEDVTIDGQLVFSDITRFFNIAYLNTFYEDDRSRILGKFGINTLDIRYALEAIGTITYRDATVTSSLREEASVVAPLPLFGLESWYTFSPKWGVATEVTLIGGHYEDVTALVVTTDVKTRYRLSKTFGAVLGISYFNGDIDVEDNRKSTNITYGYKGAYLGLHAAF